MRTVTSLVAIAVCGCPADVPPEFPADYAATYGEVRNCRPSSDHDLNNVRVVADPAAMEPYLMRDNPFPTGAIIVKEEHDFADITCSDPIKQWTVIVKLPVGSSPTTLDWHWQRVDAQRHVVTDNEPRCYGCHMKCGVLPDGYDGTCEVP